VSVKRVLATERHLGESALLNACGRTVAPNTRASKAVWQIAPPAKLGKRRLRRAHPRHLVIIEARWGVARVIVSGPRSKSVALPLVIQTVAKATDPQVNTNAEALSPGVCVVTPVSARACTHSSSLQKCLRSWRAIRRECIPHVGRGSLFVSGATDREVMMEFRRRGRAGNIVGCDHPGIPPVTTKGSDVSSLGCSDTFDCGNPATCPGAYTQDESYTTVDQLPSRKCSRGTCLKDCAAAKSVAEAACGKLPDPVTKGACKVVAKATHKLCHESCNTWCQKL
jgi:hypothetical protein